MCINKPTNWKFNIYILCQKEEIKKRKRKKSRLNRIEEKFLFLKSWNGRFKKASINHKIESLIRRETLRRPLFGRQDIESRFLYLRVAKRTRLEGCLVARAGCDYRLDDLTLARLHCWTAHRASQCHSTLPNYLQTWNTDHPMKRSRSGLNCPFGHPMPFSRHILTY